MTSRSLSNWLPKIAQLLAIAALYYCVARLSQFLAMPPGNITPVWPASGISLAAVLQLGYGVLPGIWLGEFLEAMTAFSSEANGPPLATCVEVAAAFGAAVVLEYALGAFLLQRFAGRRHLFDRAVNVFKFVALAGMVSCAAGAIVGVTSLCLSGITPWSEYAQTWWTWLLGDAVGIVVLAPVLLVWSNPTLNLRLGTLDRELSRIPNHSQTRKQPHHLKSQIQNLKISEALLLLVLLLSVCQIAFGGGYAVAYLVIPFLIWAAFRFGQRGATLLSLIVASTAIWGTVHGHGPFIRESLNESLLLLQCFVGVVAVTTMVLAAVLAEREQAQAELLQANNELEFRVKERTAALSQANEALQQSEIQLIEKATDLENALHQLQQTQTQLIHTEKMSSLGQLIAGIAHEINNPVSFIYGNLAHADEYIRDVLKLLQLYDRHYPNPVKEIQEAAEEMDVEFISEDLPKLLGSMRMGAERIRAIVLSLRNFSRLDESEMKPVDIHDGIDSTLLILQNRLQPKDSSGEIKIIKEYGDLPKIECYPGQLNQVFMNVLTNAIDVLETQPTPRAVTIRTEIGKGEGGRENCAIIRIADSGPGIPEDVLKRLFDPFFTTKPVGKGTGLGLSISYQIVVEKHGGQLRCISAPGHGTEFIIEIPIRQSSSKALAVSSDRN